MKKKNQQSVLAVKVYLTLLQSKKPLTFTQLVARTRLTWAEVYTAMGALSAENFINAKLTPKQVDTMRNDLRLMAEGKNPPLRKEAKWYAV